MVEFSFTIGTGGAWVHGNLIKEPVLKSPVPNILFLLLLSNGVMAT